MKQAENVVLFSGGLDSLAGLIWARKQFGKDKVLAIYCDIGHRYRDKEIKAVIKICKKLGQDYVIDNRLNLSSFESPKELNAIIPYRNTFFILIGALYLPESGGRIIIQNVIKGESSTIDRRAEFNENLENFLPFADHKSVQIIAPQADMTKGEICKWVYWQLGDHSIILDTVGCYSIGLENCGECNSCFRSWIAMEWAGVKYDWRRRFAKDPSKWTEGINKYIENMSKGKYHLARVQQTFEVLRDHGYELPRDTYVFDMDGVITIEPEILRSKIGVLSVEEIQNVYRNSYPNPLMIKKINELHKLHKIKIHTARHEEDRTLTEKWLEDHDVEYDELIMGKPHGTYYIDDRAVSLEDV